MNGFRWTASVVGQTYVTGLFEWTVKKYEILFTLFFGLLWISIPFLWLSNTIERRPRTTLFVHC
jgi:hypothetical protein